MKITRIYISGFGKLHQKDFEFGSGINVIYGPNESGKSTLMEAFKALLYGFTKPGLKRVVLDPEYERYRPWGESSYGGFLEYEVNGKQFRVQRSFDRQPHTAKLFALPEHREITGTLLDAKGELLVGPGQMGLNKYMFMNTCWIRQAGLVPDKDFGKNLKDQLISHVAQTEEVGYLAALQALQKGIQELGTDGAGKKPVALTRERLENLRQQKASTLLKEERLNEVLGTLRQYEREIDKLKDEAEGKEKAYQNLSVKRLGHRWEEIRKLRAEIDSLQLVLPADAAECTQALELQPGFAQAWTSWQEAQSKAVQAKEELARLGVAKTRGLAGEWDEKLDEIHERWQQARWELGRLGAGDGLNQINSGQITQPRLSAEEERLGKFTEEDIKHLLLLENKIDQLRLGGTLPVEEGEGKGFRFALIWAAIIEILLLAGLWSAGIYYGLPPSYLLAGTGILAGAFGLMASINIRKKLKERRGKAGSGRAEKEADQLQEQLETRLKTVGLRYPGELWAAWSKVRLKYEQFKEHEEIRTQKAVQEESLRLQLAGYERSLKEDLAKLDGNRALAYSDEEVSGRLRDTKMERMRQKVVLEHIGADEESWLSAYNLQQEEAVRLAANIRSLLGQVGASSEEEFRQKAVLGKKIKEYEARVKPAQELLERLLEGDSIQDFAERWSEAGQPGATGEVPESMLIGAHKEWEDARANLAKAISDCQKIQAEYALDLKDLGQLELLERELKEAEGELTVLLKKRKALELASKVIEQVEQRLREERFPLWSAKVRESIAGFSGGRYTDLHWSDDFTPKLVAPETSQDVELDQLSAGTQDMVNFALRFSLAEYLGNVPLPLFLDDPFVEVDSLRWEMIARILSEAAERHQIFLFTCHEREKELFRAQGISIHELIV